MRLLTSTLPRVRRMVQGDGGFTLGAVAVLIALEFLGHRRAQNDLHDLIAVALLAGVIAAVVMRHRHRPLPWLNDAVDWVKRLGQRILDRYFRLEMGLDLRGEPPIPRRMPRGTYTLMALLVIWSGIAVAAWRFLPDGWRTLGTHGFYLGYLLLMALVWSGLLLAVLVGTAAPLYQLHQFFGPERDGPRRAEWFCGAIYLTLVFMAAWRLPVSPALSFCVFTAGLCGVMMYTMPKLGREQFLWRDGPDKPIFAVQSRRLIMALGATLMLAMTALLLTASGSQLVGPHDMTLTMPVTLLLGSLAAWLTPGAIAAGAVELFNWWRHNPARRSRRFFYALGGHLVPIYRRRIREIARDHGWGTRWSEPPRREPSVAVELVEVGRSEAGEFDPRWPLRVSIADLEDGQVFERVTRRREIQLRRNLTRGLEKLLKAAASQKKREGSGCWLGPHLWFMAGMVRDDAEQPEDQDDGPMLARVVGPTYDQVFHRLSRQYCYQLLRALEVDLLFVEDGVSFRSFNRVLRVMFELWDRFPEGRRTQETHFNGLPKVKVMIHDFTVDKPFQNESYPEPRFEDLGRARILHVFRDRGGEEEYIEPPGDRESSPAPVLVG